MPRVKNRPTPTRMQLALLVKQHLERVGTEGLSRSELVALIPDTSPRSIQRAVDDLRAKHNAQLTCFGRLHRYRLDASLPLPLDAPNAEDLVAFIYLLGLAKPILSPAAYARIEAAVEELDARARVHHPATDLPSANVLTASYSHASRVDPRLVGHLLLACRRKTVRIHYESPWQDTPGAQAHDIEPWAIHVSDATHYVRAWSIDRKHPRTFNCAFIHSLEALADAPVRQRVPAKPWAKDGIAFGVDGDRPGIAVVRFAGAVGRWVASMRWHPEQRDRWIEPRQLLERTVPYHSCREMTRHLAQYLDGIASIESVALRAELAAHVAHAATRFA